MLHFEDDDHFHMYLLLLDDQLMQTGSQEI